MLIYFSWFLPALSLLVAVIAFFTPARPWRWGLVPFVAQAVILIGQNPSANLLPLGLIMFLVSRRVLHRSGVVWRRVPALVGAEVEDGRLGARSTASARPPGPER